MGDVALSGVLLGCGALSREVARAATIEAGRAGGGSSDRWRRQVRHGWWWKWSPRCRLLMLVLRWVGNPLLLLMLVLLLLTRRVGGPLWYTIRYLGGALPDGATTTFLFFASLCVQIASSTMMTLLTNSGNDPPMLSAMCSCSLVERSIMKRSFFLSSVSTWSGAYCVRWLNSLE
jgi:hypothetical protein